MSHLRDIQKLRQSRNIPTPQLNSNPFALTHRFSHSSSNVAQEEPQLFNLNLNINQFSNGNQNLNHHPNKQATYSKFLQSKQIIPKHSRHHNPQSLRDKRNSLHKRGSSNGVTHYENKESEPFYGNLANNTPGNQSTGLSIYNMSMKLTANNNNASNNGMTNSDGDKYTYQSSSNRTPNPLTYRRQRKQDYLDFQSAFDLKDRKPARQTTKQQKETKISSRQTREVTRNTFEVMYPIGKGGFGKVWKVQHKKNMQVYALKQMYKAKIIQKKSINSVMNERKLLAKLNHPFIINMSYAFQDRQNIYLIMDYLDGGDLRYHIGRRGRFTEMQTKFFICNLIVGLQYMHRNNIIHRDIKPQNLVLEKDGYVRITDMGISRQMRSDNHQDTSGTPGYMAPEVMVRKNHSFGVDYFAVGVMGYEFMLGKRPYIGKNRKEIRDNILAKQAGIREDDLPKKWSYEAADFINKLLTRNPTNRLGYNGIQEIKDHPWIKDIDWKRLQRKQIRAPYIPVSIQQDYEDYKDQISEDTIDDNIEENMLMLRDKEVQSLFEGYDYDKHHFNAKSIPPQSSIDKIKPRSISYTTNCTESQAKELRDLRGLREFKDFKKEEFGFGDHGGNNGNTSYRRR